MNLNRRNVFTPLCLSVAGIAAVAGLLAFTEPAKDMKPAGQPEMQLPPGWTPEDMQACMVAGTPGPMHEHLAKGVGVWNGKNTMWMAPGMDPIKSESVSTVKSAMDGRYFKCEMVGDMPGMGPFNGFGLAGFDNVSQKFVSTWIDNMSTGIMNGTGELSSDGKVLTWTFSYNCPINKKPTVMREIETITGPNTKTLEMWSTDPKSGKEFKMMQIDFTKQS